MRGLTLEGVPPAEAAQIALSTPPPRDAAGSLDLLAEEGAAPDDAGGDVLHSGGVHGMAAAGDTAGDEAGEADVADDADVADVDVADYVADDVNDDVADDATDDGRGRVARLGLVSGPRRPFLLAAPSPVTRPAGAAPAAVGSPAAEPLTASAWSLAGAEPAPDPGRGSIVWRTEDPVVTPSAPPLATAAPDSPGRSGGGRVLSLPDASPRARGLARAAMALDTVELSRILRDAVAAYGVAGAWDGMIVPVLQGLGERWRATGEGIEVEHAFCESVLGVMRGVTATLYRPRNVTPILLTCADGDFHSLPLHGIAAALAEEEVGCRMLGSGLPALALVSAVRRIGPAVVFLYARLPVTDAAVLRDLPRQRPVPRVLVGGPGWDYVPLPATVGRVGTLAESVAAVLDAGHL
jgi:hypothetical protein